MDNVSLSDRLIKGFKDLIVRFIVIFVGFMIAGGVARLSPYDPWGVYWMMIFAGVLAVYVIIVGLLQVAWSRYRRSPN
jgi:hypothetical protein